MKIYSNVINAQTVLSVFSALQSDGLIGPSVYPDHDKNHSWKPRHYAYGTEFQMGSETSTSWENPNIEAAKDYGFNYSDKAKRALRRRHIRNSGAYGAKGDQWLRYCAQWMEWGNLIAALYLIDPNAKIGQYKNQASFEFVTQCSYVSYAIKVHEAVDGRVFDFMSFIGSFPKYGCNK
jgi:hypothetical protein